MRIVGGARRGRLLSAPPGRTVRPTSDRTREALFNILAHSPDVGRRLDGCRFLDAFAGTGAVAIEALSRGAEAAILIEQDKIALDTIRKNLAACQMETQARVIAGDATKPPKAEAPCGVGYLDPPYASEALVPALLALTAAGWFTPEAVVGLELARAATLTPPAGWRMAVDRHYGAARLVLLERQA
ncbi:MAG: 16S rRNA (guanine(966)-N(2))-methyltransferase RsmD [Alphaproteobacteria bacterium]|nr:MAG: 16S rRNA (guanine(966)-N(2))-methyltransferase RsmD [Alphaproteobacteria bacterium]